MTGNAEIDGSAYLPPAPMRQTFTSDDVVRRVLIVEDQQAIAELLSDVLSDAGFQTSRAYSAVTAAETARALAPDVILLDVMMPERTGWEVLEELRAHESTRGTPVVIVSAVYDRFGLHSMPAGGPIRFAAKPFDIVDLVETVTQLTS
jgi:CheY-like chemotaxis protein